MPGSRLRRACLSTLPLRNKKTSARKPAKVGCVRCQGDKGRAGGYHRMRDGLSCKSRPIVGNPTVTIPFCILFNTVIPVTVEIIVNVFHLDRAGYVTVSVNTCPSSSCAVAAASPSTSLDRLDNSISVLVAPPPVVRFR